MALIGSSRRPVVVGPLKLNGRLYGVCQRDAMGTLEIAVSPSVWTTWAVVGVAKEGRGGWFPAVSCSVPTFKLGHRREPSQPPFALWEPLAPIPLQVLEVQLPNKKVMASKAFHNGLNASKKRLRVAEPPPLGQ